jgi:acyl dehydratase
MALPLPVHRVFQVAIRCLAAVLALYGIGWMCTPTRQALHFRTQRQLAGVARMVLLFLLRRKRIAPLPRVRQISVRGAPAPLLTAAVEAYELKSQDVERFIALVANAPARGARSSAAALPPATAGAMDAALFVFPHVATQSLAMTLMTHADFPISLIGSVHLRSLFTVHERSRLSALLGLGTSGSAPPANSSNTIRFVASYYGVAAAANGKGVDVYVSLEAYDGSERSPTAEQSPKLLWSEVMVIFAQRRARPADLFRGIPTSHRLTNEEIASWWPQLASVDFTSITAGQTTTTTSTVSADDTWKFGTMSGDVNPIHMSGIGARLFGQQSRIAHGMLVVAKTIAARPEGMPDAWVVTFKAPVPCGSSVALIRDEPSAHSAADNSKGRFDIGVILKATNALKLPGKPNICVREAISSAAPRTFDTAASLERAHL